MKFKHQVFLCRFPFDDASDNKTRPALCLTEPIGPNFHVVVAFITSQIPDDIESYDLLFELGQPETQRMGLKLRSVLRLHRLYNNGCFSAPPKVGTIARLA